MVLDHLFKVPHLPEPNTSIQVSNTRRFFGGTGGNIARAAARLGVKTSLASFVGEDFPEDYRKLLLEDGIDLTDLRILPGYRTPVAWIFSDPEGNQVAVIDQGPMAEAADFEVLEHTVRANEVVHVATGRPEYYLQVVKLARDLGKRVGFDPSQEIHYVYKSTSFRDLFTRSDIFFGNRSEFQRALGYLGLKDVVEMLQYVQVLILTQGTEGSIIHTEEQSWKIPSMAPARSLDVTGAGDAYRGGFYAGLSKGFDLPLCGLLGAAAASFSVEGQGPQTGLPTWSEAWERAEEYSDHIVKISS